MIILRDYQEKGVGDIRFSYRNGKRRPLFVSRTGSGKTVLFSYIAENAKGRTLIIVHRDNLLKQASKTLNSHGIAHGIIVSSRPMFLSQRVQVASLQTIVNRLNSMPEFDLIIIDESHHALPGSAYDKVLNRYPDARALGVTASPIGSGGRGLGGIFDDIVFGPTLDSLVNAGHLVRPKIFSCSHQPDLSNVKTSNGEYNKTDIDAVMSDTSIVGDAVSHYKQIAHGRAGVAFCVSVKHAEQVSQSFRDAGVSAKCIHGNLSDEEKDDCISGLTSGKYQILTACDIISEGTDIPRIEVAILLRPTKSLALYIQQVGRALRPYAGKAHAIILDHCGNTARMWDMFEYHIEDEYEWELNPDKKKKKKKQEIESVKVCEKCYCTFLPKKICTECAKPECKCDLPKVVMCPNYLCKFIPASKARTVDEIEGQLVELTKDDIKKQISKQKKLEESNCRTFEDFLSLGIARGYEKARAWAEKRMQFRSRRFG